MHHEIDIFVTIDLGQGYKSVFIFECKNWADAVGENEIIVFQEKLDAGQAQHGFFVAKSFTADAKAQASKEPRLSLLFVTEHSPEATPVPFDFHIINLELLHIDATFHGWKHAGEESLVDLNTARANFQGSPVNIDQYLKAWAVDASNTKALAFRSERCPQGAYDQSTSAIREFGDGEFLLEGESIKKAELSVAFRVHVLRPPIVSHYEVRSRGRSLRFAPVGFGEDAMQVSLTFGPGSGI